VLWAVDADTSLDPCAKGSFLCFPMVKSFASNPLSSSVTVGVSITGTEQPHTLSYTCQLLNLHFADFFFFFCIQLKSHTFDSRLCIKTTL